MKMASLLNSEVHIFLLTWWLTQQVTGLTKNAILDMASNVFDDQYEGCVREMEKKAPQMLKEDFYMNKALKTAWEEAEEHWKTKVKKAASYPQGFSDFHGTALVAYTGIHIATDFNKATREFKKTRKSNSLDHFRAFHYYLTRALQLLSNPDCYFVYRGVKTNFNYPGKGSVRFGQFSSASLVKERAIAFLAGSKKSIALPFQKRDKTLFVITTCLGVKIKAFSVYPHEEEVLIPGYEVYHKVTQAKEPVAADYDEIYLASPQVMKSNFNCYYYNKLHSRSGTPEIPVLLLLLPALLVQLLPSAEL